MAMNPRLLVPRASGFDPRRISGLVGWWDFSDISTLRQTTAGATAVAADGDVVGWVADKSGNNRAMAANNDGRRPTYKVNLLAGRGGLRFDGSDDCIGATTHTGTAPDEQTWFGVYANMSSASTSRRFLARADNAGLFVNLGISPAGIDYWARGSAVSGGNAIADAVFSLSYTSGSCIVRQNGATQVTVTTPNLAYTTATSLFVGANSLAGANATACDALEVLIYHVALTNSQRLSVERYLALKYGLTLT